LLSMTNEFDKKSCIVELKPFGFFLEGGEEPPFCTTYAWSTHDVASS
jgi:hypothetical protein